jgi:flagellar assembly protein FliH
VNERPALNQRSYQESAYEDSRWEIIGELEKNDTFTPMEIAILGGNAPLVDPMFADYGGRSELSGSGSFKYGGNIEQEAKVDPNEARKIKLLPEELQAKIEEAKRAGFAAGKAEAEQAAAQQRTAMEQRLHGVLQDLVGQINESLERMEKDAVTLSLSISQKIINQAVEINPEYIVQLVRESLAHAGGAGIKRVRVSPQDMEFIEVVGVARQLKEFDGSWNFEADPAIKTGCVVDTSAGEVDFQLDRSWERVRDNVVRVIRGRP